MRQLRHSYGADASQFGDLREGGEDVAVLVHGGFWRRRYDLTLMDALAEDLAARGWTAWNVEYRRLGNGGGMPATVDDVGAAIDHLADLGLGGGRVVAIGHSAGGHLAAWSATRAAPRVRLTGVVSQAGVLDTRRALELNLSNGVAREFLAASPIEHAPLGVPTLLTHGGRDDIVPVELSERFAAAAGDEADLVIEPDEDHFGHLDPSNPLWEAVIRWL